GLELLNRLSAVCGVRRGPATDGHYGFPSPRVVALAQPAKYQAIGFSRQKVRALLTLARAIERGDVDLETLSGKDDSTVCAQLLALRGVDRWSAEYVMLRGLGRLHVFRRADVGARERLPLRPGRSSPLDYGVVR